MISFVVDELGYKRLDRMDGDDSYLIEDEYGFIRLDAVKPGTRAGMTLCTPGRTVPCGNVCRQPQNCKKKGSTPATAEGKPQQTKTAPAKAKSKVNASLKDVRSNKLSRSEQKEFDDVSAQIKAGKTDVYEARTKVSPRVAEMLSREGLGTKATVGKSVGKKSTFETTKQEKAATQSQLGAARRAQEEQDKERASRKKTSSGDVSKLIGSAAKLREGKPIKSQEDFNRDIDKAYSLIDKEKNRDGLVPIAMLRDALGDRVSDKDFDRYFAESSARDGYQSIGGEAAELPGYSVKSLIERGIQTSLGGKRFYLKKK